MATRQARHIIKNTTTPNMQLPVSVYPGEPLVNLSDGIMFFSGFTGGSPAWVPSNNTTSGYFEVGSNIYDLKIRHRIIGYEGNTNVSGQFLSGTSSGFTLAPIASIVGVDTYPTGFTYSNNTFTIQQNISGPTLTALFNTVTGLTVTGTISAITSDAATILSGGTSLITVLDNRFVNTTGDTMTGSLTINNNLTVTGNTNVSGNTTATDLYLNGRLKSYSGATNVSGKFLSGTTDGFQLANISDIGSITSYTYSPTTNTFTINQSNGNNYSALINQMSGLTIGSGGSVSGHGTGDLVVHGNLTVYGGAISAYTGELYIEDNNIYMNYNPTGSTAAYSLGAGWSIQDGNGLAGGNAYYEIHQMNLLTGSPSPSIAEYVGATGYGNRGFATQLNDIVIRATTINPNTPAANFNGVRVLAEFDILDGGSY